MKTILTGMLASSMAITTLAAPGEAKPMRVPAKPADIEKVKEALPSKAPAKPSKERKILVFYRCEGFVHSSIPLGVETMRLLGEKTGAFTTESSMDLEMFTPEKLNSFDAILFLSTTQLDPEPDQKKALLDFVRSGKGIIGIHAAADNFYEWEEGAKMIGGLFCGHPWTAGCTVQVKLDEPDHPINKCFDGESFRITDEIYQFKDPYSRDNQRIIASLDLSDPDTKAVKGGNPDVVSRTDGDFGITWLRQEGKGRVFYCSMGHNEHIFWDERVLQHYLAGIQYALGDYDVPDAVE
jgi:type 1 glutamine amidotransferase